MNRRTLQGSYPSSSSIGMCVCALSCLLLFFICKFGFDYFCVIGYDLLNCPLHLEILKFLNKLRIIIFHLIAFWHRKDFIKIFFLQTGRRLIVLKAISMSLVVLFETLPGQPSSRSGPQLATNIYGGIPLYTIKCRYFSVFLVTSFTFLEQQKAHKWNNTSKKVSRQTPRENSMVRFAMRNGEGNKNILGFFFLRICLTCIFNWGMVSSFSLPNKTEWGLQASWAA